MSTPPKTRYFKLADMAGNFQTHIAGISATTDLDGVIAEFDWLLQALKYSSPSQLYTKPCCSPLRWTILICRKEIQARTTFLLGKASRKNWGCFLGIVPPHLLRKILLYI